jgi:hypothetical protein
MRKTIKKILREYRIILEDENMLPSTMKVINCKDIIYSDSRSYGTKGWAQKSLKQNNKYYGPIIKRDDQIDKMCNCCDDGRYIRDIKCEDAYIEHLLKIASDRSVKPFMWFKKNCDVKKDKSGDKERKEKSRKSLGVFNDTSITILEDDLSYKVDAPPPPPKPNFILSVFGNIVQDSFDLLKPHEYAFEMREFVKFDNQPSGTVDKLKKYFRDKVVDWTNFLSWIIMIEVNDFSINYGMSKEGVSEGYVSIDMKIAITNNVRRMATIKIKGSGKAKIDLVDNDFKCVITDYILEGDVVSFLDFQLSMDTNNILHIAKGKYIDIPIDLSEHIKLNFDYKIPIPSYIPFDVSIPENEKTLYGSMKKESKKLEVTDISSVFSSFIEISNTPPEMNENTNNIKSLIQQKFSDKILKILKEQSEGNENITSIQMIINFNVLQNVLNHIGSITFTHKLSDFVDNSLINPMLNIVWDKIKNNDVILTISNLYVFDISNNLIGLSGVATIKSQPLFVIKKSDGDGNLLGYDIDIDINRNEYIQKNIPFGSTIYVLNEGKKIKMGMGSLKLNIHKFFKLGLKEKRNEMDAEFDFIPNSKDSEIIYPTGEKSPFKMEFPIPPIKKEELNFSFGYNKKGVVIQPSNQYQITLTENSVSSVTQINLEKI